MQDLSAATITPPEAPPFDTAKLDALMEDAGLDAVLATSPHNTRYLLGGYRFFFFATMQAIGHSRYLPAVLYVKGAPEKAAYIANPMENWQAQIAPFWTPAFIAATWTSLASAENALGQIKAAVSAGARIGVERPFLPADAHACLVSGLGAERLGDATGVLERLRAIKTPAELDLLRKASEGIDTAMAATLAAAGPGMTKTEFAERLRREETGLGLEFDYCLLTFGVETNRAPSGRALAAGDVISVDSGGNFEGYIGDIARMGILGEPDAELEDILAEIDQIQQASFAPVRAGTPGAELLAAGMEALAASSIADCTDFVAHGMGLVSHEAPFLMTNSIYDGIDAEHPLEAGMAISVETTASHPRRGFIKLEDTIIVTAGDHELFAPDRRGWIQAGKG